MTAKLGGAERAGLGRGDHVELEAVVVTATHHQQRAATMPLNKPLRDAAAKLGEATTHVEQVGPWVRHHHDEASRQDLGRQEIVLDEKTHVEADASFAPRPAQRKTEETDAFVLSVE